MMLGKLVSYLFVYLSSTIRYDNVLLTFCAQNIEKSNKMNAAELKFSTEAQTEEREGDLS